MGSGQNKWVIVFLIYADFIDSQNPKLPVFQSAYAQELDEFLKNLFETKFDTDKIDIYIIFGSLTYKKKNDAGEMKPFSSVDLFTFIPGDDPITHVDEVGKGFVGESSANELGAFSIQRSDTLGKIFGKVKSRYKDQNNVQFILNTWNHGSAFGIFKSENHLLTMTGFPDIDELKFPNLFKLIKKIPEEKKSSIPEMSRKNDILFVQNNTAYRFKAPEFNGKQVINLYNEHLEFNEEKTKLFFKKEVFSTDKGMPEKLNNFIYSEIQDTPGKINVLLDKFSQGMEVVPAGILEILTNEEIGRAIKIGFEGDIAIVAMMNCWMMNLHTLYALKDSVEYLVAPQGFISNPVYDYKTIIEKISAEDLSSEQIARSYITTSCDFVKREITDEEIQKKIQCWALMVASVKNNKDIIEVQLVDAITDIARTMIKSLTTADNNLTREKRRSYFLFYTRTCFNFSFGFRFFQTDLLNWIRTIEGFNAVLESKSILEIDSIRRSFRLEKMIRSLFIEFKDNFFLKDSYVFFVKNFQDTSFKGITRDPPNGISLYIPSTHRKDKIAENLFKGTGSDEEKQLRLSSKIPEWIEFIDLVTKMP